MYITKANNYNKCEAHLRNCGDYLIFSNTKMFFSNCVEKVKIFIKNILILEDSKKNSTYDYFRKYILVNETAYNRQMEDEKLRREIKKVLSTVESISGWISHANSYNLSSRMELENVKYRLNTGF